MLSCVPASSPDDYIKTYPTPHPQMYTQTSAVDGYMTDYLCSHNYTVEPLNKDTLEIRTLLYPGHYCGSQLYNSV